MSDGQIHAALKLTAAIAALLSLHVDAADAWFVFAMTVIFIGGLAYLSRKCVGVR